MRRRRSQQLTHAPLRVCPCFRLAQGFITLSRAHMAVQRFDLAVTGYERALALSPGHAEATTELGEARLAAARQAEHERAVSAAAAQAVASARDLAQRHVPGQGNGGAHAGNGLRGVTRPRGDVERPREQRRGLWGGELDEAEAAEAEQPAARLRTDA